MFKMCTFVYSPERKLCSNPLYMVKGMRSNNLGSLKSLKVARKVLQNDWLPLVLRNSLARSRSMLSRNTATKMMARTPTPAGTSNHKFRQS